MKCGVFVLALLLTSQCSSQPVEESVVSVYTTQTTTSGTTAPLNVYNQIANNVVERITSPLFRLFGINTTTTTPRPTTQRFKHIELSDDQDLTKELEIKPITNEIPQNRDVEELSVEALQKTDKKPEKITLYSSYLPVASDNISEGTENSKKNTTKNDEDDDFDSFEIESFDDDVEKPREGPLVYWVELIGSVIQLLWGGLVSFFRPSDS